MKTFIISLVIFFIIISSITIYVFFLNSTLDEFQIQIKVISDAANADDWNKAESECNKLHENWHGKIKLIEVFTNHNKTDAISQYILEIKNHIINKDKKQLNVTSDKLSLSLDFLYDDELPTLENIV